MVNTLTYRFQELPLIEEGGFRAGLLDGSATVAFHRDGEWFVRDIFLEGYGAKGIKPVPVDNVAIYLTIWTQLTDGRFKDLIQAEVQAKLDDAGISPRSDRAEHSTLHRAYAGV